MGSLSPGRRTGFVWYRDVPVRVLTPVLLYLAWLFSIALTFLDWMALRALVRTVAIEYFEAIPTAQRVEQRLHPSLIIPAIDRIMILVMGVLALGLVFAIEHVYRTAANEGMLKKRFIQTTALQVGVLIVCFALTLIIEMI